MTFGIKNKIRLGTLFLFFLLILSGWTSIHYFALLKKESQQILKANYESLVYCHAIQEVLDGYNKNISEIINVIETNLAMQEKNITEVGEKEYTESLRSHFEQFKYKPSAPIVQAIRKDLQNILMVNMQAIQRKNELATIAANKATIYLYIISAFIFLIAFTFAIRFPTIILVPMKKMKEAVKEIANKNYKHRIVINATDEFSELGNAFNLMAEKIESYANSNLNKLMFEKTRAEAVINSLKDASIGIDKDNKILFANQQALNLMGLNAKEIIGKQVSEVSTVNDLFHYLIERNQSAPFKIVVDNKECYFTKETNDITKDDEELGTVISLKNITTFQEKDVAKTNFLATISHELKTPLASSDIGLKLLQYDKTGNLTEQQLEIISDLQKDNQRLIKLVSELLDLSQAETGNINLTINSTSAKEIIEFAVNSMKQQANDKNVSIEMKLDENIKPINADKEKASWVLINLLSNAIRYSPSNDKIIIVAKNSIDNKVEISIKDNGLGIPKEYQEKIFQRFFRVPGTTSLSKGTGLGLSISKEFMTAMGGGINLKSDTGAGTEFILQFQSVAV
jgi:NtrC-family two-component system sensor histidine kinase KinB